MRAKRKAANKSQTEIARVMKITKGYLSDLELGRRDWNAALVNRYEGALKPERANGKE